MNKNVNIKPMMMDGLHADPLMAEHASKDDVDAHRQQHGEQETYGPREQVLAGEGADDAQDDNQHSGQAGQSDGMSVGARGVHGQE
jgi:hypothetical protein